MEAGSGSAGLTVALAWMVGDTGRVYTCEKRPEFSELAGKNLERAGLAHRVSRYCQDIAEGFPEEAWGADALFLDVRTPWDYLDQAAAVVSPGAPIGFLLPTVNQISDLLRSLEDSAFQDVEVLEILHRRYKPRARPPAARGPHGGPYRFPCIRQAQGIGAGTLGGAGARGSGRWRNRCRGFS